MPDILIYTAAMVGLLFLFFLGVERARPLRRRTRTLLPRLFLNLIVSAMAFVTAAMLIRPLVAQLLELSGERPFGLLHLLPLPVAGQFVVGFLLMDLSFYYWHVLNHRIPFLWRFHNVHHADPDLDVSTGFRFHFGEVGLSAVFRAAQVTVIGPSAWIYLVYELVFQANTLFHHSNVRLPIRVERMLNRVLVTPRMHGIHHSQVRDETHSNYSVVFSWWDRVHRSIGLDIPQSEIAIGVPGYSKPEDNRFWNLLAMPFRKQRSYWAGRDGESLPVKSRSRKETRHRLEE